MQHQYEVQPVKRDQEADSGEATIDEIGRLPLILQVTTLSVYRSRFEALPSIGSAIFAVHAV